MTVMRPLTAAIVTCAITAGCTSATVPIRPSAPAAAPPAAPAPPPTAAATIEIRTTAQGRPLAGAAIEVRKISDLSPISTGLTTDDQGRATLPATGDLMPGTVVLVQATMDKTVISGLFLVPPSGFATAQATGERSWLLDLASSVAARKLTSKLAEVLRSSPAGTPTDVASLMNQLTTLVADTRQALNGRFTDERVNAAARAAAMLPNRDTVEGLANALVRFSPLRGGFVGAVDACNGQVVANLLAGGALVAPSPWQIAEVQVVPPLLTVSGDSQIRITHAGRAETITVERAAAALAAANAASTATSTNQAFAQVNTTIVPNPANGGGGNPPAAPRTGIITTIAGTGATTSDGDGGLATAASFLSAHGMAMDSAGHLYVCQPGGYRIRKIDADTQIVTRFAGTGASLSDGDDGPASDAKIYAPVDLAITGNDLYVAESAGHRIRKINLGTGIITTFAGDGTKSSTGDNGQATAATINAPYGLALDGTGNLYVAEYSGHRIRKINLDTGIITTFAGDGTQSSTGDNGLATAATINAPHGLAFDGMGNLYVSESTGHRIRKIDANGIITTVVGDGTQSSTGDNGPATDATINTPHGLAFDGAGNLYIAEFFGHRIRKIDANGIITTVAGDGTNASSGDHGPASQAQLSGPASLFFDPNGNLYVAEAIGHRIRKILL